MRGKWLLISGTVILMAIAAGALSLLRRERQAPVQAAPAPSAAVYTGADVSLTGPIRAQQVVSVGVPIDGTIEEMLVEAGQEVFEGQLLARIKNTGLEVANQVAAAALERAQTRLSSLEAGFIAARLEASRAHAEASRSQSDFDRAQKLYLRQQMLYKEGATPRLTYEKAEAEYQAAQAESSTLAELARQAEERATALTAQIDEAKKSLDEKTQELESSKQGLAAEEIYSPVDGLVIGRSRQVGEEVDPEVKDLFQIAVNLTLLEAVLDPEPPVLARIHPGQDAEVQVAELAGQSLPGKVKEVQGTQVVVEFTTPDPAVRPGLTAHVRIKLT